MPHQSPLKSDKQKSNATVMSHPESFYQAKNDTVGHRWHCYSKRSNPLKHNISMGAVKHCSLFNSQGRIYDCMADMNRPIPLHRCSPHSACFTSVTKPNMVLNYDCHVSSQQS